MLGYLGAILDAIGETRGGFNWGPPVGALKLASWGNLGALLGRSWAALGRSWAPLRPFLAALGAALGNLGAISRLQKPVGSEEARSCNNKHVFFR